MSASAEISSCCLSCGKPLWGRLDKKFCHTGCKNAYSNCRQREERLAMGEIDVILKRNRRILQACLGTDHTKRIPQEELAGRGYRFDFYTHHFTNNKGRRYCFCYEFGFLLLDTGGCLVVRKRAGTKSIA